jgi:hypothetical protein
MAAKDKPGKAAEAALAQGEKYFKHLLADDELRSTLLNAYSSGRSAYGRLSNGKGATHALFSDPKLQQELLGAATALRNATTRLKEPAPKVRPPRRGRAPRRGLMLLLVGGILAIALNSELRSKVLDLMFGAEEEFDYTSTTTPATPAPAGVSGS